MRVVGLFAGWLLSGVLLWWLFFDPAPLADAPLWVTIGTGAGLGWAGADIGWRLGERLSAR